MNHNVKDGTDLIAKIKEHLANLNKMKLTSKKLDERRWILFRKQSDVYNQQREAFAELIRKLQSKQKRVVEVTRRSIMRQSGVWNGGADEDRRLDNDILVEQMQEIDFTEDILKQRERQLDVIHRAVEDIKDLMIDTAKEVDQQGQMLDIVSDNVVKSKENTKAANKELHQAEQYNREDNKTKIACMLVIGLVAIGVILTILFLR
eukprot:TRINITY_DN5026_c0_g1_i14.p1 TRINITY_DN5026_c0_g1~~TRINITY_DN5026_c0_g1_i14.p1  ORF type:complete len:205 (-),score=54.29 TRINITY_DN5026_c0_g1_i14:88-702(-)